MKNKVKIRITTFSGLTEYYTIEGDLPVTNEDGNFSQWILAKGDKIEVLEDSL